MKNDKPIFADFFLKLGGKAENPNKYLISGISQGLLEHYSRIQTSKDGKPFQLKLNLKFFEHKKYKNNPQELVKALQSISPDNLSNAKAITEYMVKASKLYS